MVSAAPPPSASVWVGGLKLVDRGRRDEEAARDISLHLSLGMLGGGGLMLVGCVGCVGCVFQKLYGEANPKKAKKKKDKGDKGADEEKNGE